MGAMNVLKRRESGKVNAIPRGVAGLLLLAWGGMANAANNEVTVSTEVLEGTCAVSIKHAGAPVVALSLGNIQSNQLVTNGAMAGFEPVELALSSCGLGGASKTPTVSLDSSDFAVANDVPGANSWTLRGVGTAGGSSHGYFIFVANTPTGVWAPYGAGTPNGVFGRGTPIPMAAAGATAEGVSKMVYLGVGCGNSGNCVSSTTYGGTVKANLVFSFLYK